MVLPGEDVLGDFSLSALQIWYLGTKFQEEQNIGKLKNIGKCKDSTGAICRRTSGHVKCHVNHAQSCKCHTRLCKSLEFADLGYFKVPHKRMKMRKL